MLARISSNSTRNRQTWAMDGDGVRATGTSAGAPGGFLGEAALVGRVPLVADVNSRLVGMWMMSLFGVKRMRLCDDICCPPSLFPAFLLYVRCYWHRRWQTVPRHLCTLVCASRCVTYCHDQGLEREAYRTLLGRGGWGYPGSWGRSWLRFL